MASQIPYLDVQNLTKRFGAQVLFDNISFSIAEGQKVGLVARNGTGKSTLMSVLMDKEGHESGDIIYRRDLKVGYLEQSPQFDPEESVLQACFNHEDDPEKVLKAKQILTQLHITNLEQPMGQLSGGQQKRVALANVLITEPDFLMLDEPTNHLDLEMIEWLEGYLNRGNKTIFMVTHDRFFLDRVCNTILELDDRTIYTYRGNYAYYLEKRQERMDNLRAEIQHSKNLYRRELDWMRRQPQARGHKAKYREDAFYELEKVAKQRIEDRQVRLKASTVYIGSKIFECQYVSKAFDDRGQKKVILDNFYYNFARFEKMGIVGNNGTGKSTFIKMLLGEVQPDSGKFDIGETVRFGYFSQEGLKFREDQKVIDVITEIADYSGRRQAHDGFAVSAVLPLYARGAAQLRLQAERRREAQALPLYGADEESELPGAGRADQRPRHPDAAGTGRISSGFCGLRHRGEPRPLFHGQGSRPSAGFQGRRRNTGFPRQLYAVQGMEPDAGEGRGETGKERKCNGRKRRSWHGQARRQF